MQTTDTHDMELAARLRRLDAVTGDVEPGFDFQALWQRHAAAQSRARRRRGLARGTASAVMLALVALSAWRLAPREQPPADVEARPAAAVPAQPRLVRADTYLALAAIEDHIATIDDALNDARLVAPRGAEVARLERTRAELMDSYVRVRYADMVSNNF
jgi:hypothetical protein